MLKILLAYCFILSYSCIISVMKKVKKIVSFLITLIGFIYLLSNYNDLRLLLSQIDPITFYLILFSTLPLTILIFRNKEVKWISNMSLWVFLALVITAILVYEIFIFDYVSNYENGGVFNRAIFYFSTIPLTILLTVMYNKYLEERAKPKDSMPDILNIILGVTVSIAYVLLAFILVFY